MLGEVSLADTEGRKVAFSRRTQQYSSWRRYWGAAGTFAHVIPEVSLLVEAGLLIEERAKPGTRGYQSTLRASEALRNAMSDLAGTEVVFHLEETLIMRNELAGGLRQYEPTVRAGSSSALAQRVWQAAK